MYRDTLRRSEMYSCKINFICKDGAPRMKQFACLCEAFVAPEGLLLWAIIHLHCLPPCGSALLVAWTNVVLSSNIFCGNFMNIIHNMCSKIKINTTSFPVQKRFFSCFPWFWISKLGDVSVYTPNKFRIYQWFCRNLFYSNQFHGILPFTFNTGNL